MPRPRRAFTFTEMVQAARLFHLDRLTNTQIAGRLEMDVHRVSELLDEALKRNIVSIQIFESLEDNLEQSLKAKYPHLEKVMIVPGREPTTPEQCNELFGRFGRLAAHYLSTLHKNRPWNKPLHVGVTGGARLLEFANAIPKAHRENIYVHAAALVGHGPLRDATSHIEPSVAASILWTRCGSVPGRCEYETVEPYRLDGTPGVAARKQVAETLERLATISSIEKVIRNMDRLDVMFAGFGFLNRPDATESMENRITMASLLESVVTPNTLAEEGALGDFCYCPFDADGNGRDQWRFFLTAGHYDHPGIEFFKHMVASGKKVVGFGGPYLVPVIRAALKGKIVNVLIIDGATAGQLAESD
jgi:DNA-binding transcriptional regulator LsrR (DeoR family)